MLVMFLLLMSRQSWAQDAQSPAQDLARILRDKQVITSSEYDRIVAAGETGGVVELATILRDKGVLSPAEADSLTADGSAAIVGDPPPKADPLPKADPPPKQADNNHESGRKLNFYGTLLFNGFYNNVALNNEDIPAFALPRTTGPKNNFGATGRQTRLGLSYSGLTLGGANITGTAEADFFGGEPALTNGINMDVVRMRLAYGRLDWKRFAIEGGQDWAVFAPLNPTSLAEFAIPQFSASGNLWSRTPQIRTEWKRELGKQKTFLWQMAALDPDIGDNPAAYSTARQPRAGELGGWPSGETRLAFSAPIAGRTATIGVSGHVAAAKNVGAINGVSTVRNFTSWGAAADYSLPVSKIFSISGEAYAGSALGLFSGGIAQTLNPVGQPGDIGVRTRGGWLQVQLNLIKQVQVNTAYGIDAPVLRDLPTGSRSKNQNYTSNIIYHLSPNVAFGTEWQRFLTDYRNQASSNNRGNHFNFYAAYTF